MLPENHRPLACSSLAIVLLACVSLGACAYVEPDPVVSPRLDSGITSQNGGGARALGNTPNMGITVPTGPVR